MFAIIEYLFKTVKKEQIMSEMEKAKRAKYYMDQLAAGIDPISNKNLKEIGGDRMCKCFSYVSGLLEKVIQNGGEIGGCAPVIDKDPSRALSDKPVAIREFLKKIEEAGGRSVPAGRVTGWLVKEGYLEEKTDAEGKAVRRVSAKGAKLGITTENKKGKDGEIYAMNFYNRAAQQFVLLHLNEIGNHMVRKNGK